jgi:tellurite resistance protein TerC
MNLTLATRLRSWFESRRPWLKIRQALRLNELPPATRKVVVGVMGTTVMIAGIAMVVLPGPAFLVIPLGLAILASEFFWARRLLRKAQGLFRKPKSSAVGS